MAQVEEMLRERIAELRDELRRTERALAALSPAKKTNGKRRRSSRRTKKNGTPTPENIAAVRDFLLQNRGGERQAAEIAEAVDLSKGTVSTALKALADDADSLVKHNGKGGAYSAYMIPEQEEVVA